MNYASLITMHDNFSTSIIYVSVNAKPNTVLANNNNKNEFVPW